MGKNLILCVYSYGVSLGKGKVKQSCSSTEYCERQSHRELVAFLCRVHLNFPRNYTVRVTAGGKRWVDE